MAGYLILPLNLVVSIYSPSVSTITMTAEFPSSLAPVDVVSGSEFGIRYIFLLVFGFIVCSFGCETHKICFIIIFMMLVLAVIKYFFVLAK